MSVIRTDLARGIVPYLGWRQGLYLFSSGLANFRHLVDRMTESTASVSLVFRSPRQTLYSRGLKLKEAKLNRLIGSRVMVSPSSVVAEVLLVGVVRWALRSWYKAQTGKAGGVIS